MFAEHRLARKADQAVKPIVTGAGVDQVLAHLIMQTHGAPASRDHA